MAELKVLYFLVVILHGGQSDPFSLTRLGSFADAAACETAAKTVSAALEGANQATTPRAEIGCIASSKINALNSR